MSLSFSTPVLGAIYALGASLAFTQHDMAIKVLSEEYSLYQIIFTRSVIAMALLLGVFMPLAGGYRHLRTAFPGRHALRGILVVSSNMAFYLALSSIPLADATAIFFASPLIIAVFSVVFLGEKVGWHRWGAILAGLIGVIIMIRPGSDSFTPIALLPLLAATAYAAMQTMTRRMGVSDSALTLSFYAQAVFLAFSSGFGLTFGDGSLDPGGEGTMNFLLRSWIWPQWDDVPLFALAGLGTALGGWMIAQAYRTCEAALVAPLEYVAMPMAIFWGVLVFQQWPDRNSWVGIGLILAAGLYMVYRETRPR